jgi:type III secretion protein U
MELPRLAAPARGTLAALGGAAERLGLRIVLVTLALGVLDAVVARARHRRALLMTRDEVRRERKEREGDDAHRALRRRVQREQAGEGTEPTADVRGAAVVVVASGAVPIAVALAYEPKGPAAPAVLVKGQGALVPPIERAARAAGVPIADHPALAQALAGLSVGDEIPEACYEEVAGLLQSVFTHETGLK